MIELDCQWQEAREIKVGDRLKLICKSASHEAPTITDLKLAQLEVDDSSFRLVPLTLVKSDADELIVEVTSYQPKPQSKSEKGEKIKLVWQGSEFELKGLQIQVSSVLPPPQQGQAPKAFPPMGPFRPLIGLDVYFYISLLGLIWILALSAIFRLSWRRMQLKKLLKKHLGSNVSADKEFHQKIRDLRKLLRSREVLEAEEAIQAFEAFRIFFLRNFEISIWGKRKNLLRELSTFKKNIQNESLAQRLEEILIQGEYFIEQQKLNNKSFKQDEIYRWFDEITTWVEDCEKIQAGSHIRGRA